MWAVGCGGAWGCLCAGLEGGPGAEGASGGPSLLPTWNRQPEGGCPPRGAEGLTPGQEAWGWGQADPTPWQGGRSPPQIRASGFSRVGCGAGWLGCPRPGSWQHSWPVEELKLDVSRDTHEGLTRSRAAAPSPPFPQSCGFPPRSSSVHGAVGPGIKVDLGTGDRDRLSQHRPQGPCGERNILVPELRPWPALGHAVQADPCP